MPFSVGVADQGVELSFDFALHLVLLEDSLGQTILPLIDKLLQHGPNVVARLSHLEEDVDSDLDQLCRLAHYLTCRGVLR